MTTTVLITTPEEAPVAVLGAIRPEWLVCTHTDVGDINRAIRDALISNDYQLQCVCHYCRPGRPPHDLATGDSFQHVWITELDNACNASTIPRPPNLHMILLAYDREQAAPWLKQMDSDAVEYTLIDPWEQLDRPQVWSPCFLV